MPRFRNRRNTTIRLDRSDLDEPVVLDRCVECKIEGEEFTDNSSGESQLRLKNCERCRIVNCKFHDKSTIGNFIEIVGERSRDNIIERCEFWDHTFDDRSGGEPIRIGTSHTSGCRFKTIVRNCYFHNLRADPETISIKSCENILENNLHENCRSNFVIRHGVKNIIRNNVFKGSGGIRVCGSDNKIIGNLHLNNDNEDYRPLRLENGDRENDRHVDRDGDPSDEEGESHDDYARVKRCLIEGNIYENCEGIVIIWGRRQNNRRKPTNNTFRDNLLIAEEETSRFLRFRDGADADDNEFEDNKMYGRGARRGDLPERAVRTLSDRPPVRRPPAGLEAPEMTAAHS